MIKVQFYDYGCGVLDIENEEPEALDADASNASSGENRRGGRGDKKDEDHKEGEGAGE